MTHYYCAQWMTQNGLSTILRFCVSLCPTMPTHRLTKLKTIEQSKAEVPHIVPLQSVHQWQSVGKGLPLAKELWVGEDKGFVVRAIWWVCCASSTRIESGQATIRKPSTYHHFSNQHSTQSAKETTLENSLENSLDHWTLLSCIFLHLSILHSGTHGATDKQQSIINLRNMTHDNHGAEKALKHNHIFVTVTVTCLHDWLFFLYL